LHKIVVERKKQVRLGGSAAAATAAPLKKKKTRVIKEEALDNPDLPVSGDGIGRTVI
jgi:hypothetical protein